VRRRQITETKRHLDGTSHRFRCELIALRPEVAIVLFRHWRGRSAGGFRFPKGSRTYGFFWRRRAYSLYRMVGPSGRLIAHRFDVLEDVRLSEREVSYLDLLLDVWVAPDGTVTVEDDDEVEEYAARGLLSRAQQRRIARTRELIARDHRRIEREAEELLRVRG
jgi:hypothetical protein